MAKIYLGGAGGAPTNNVIASLRASGDDYLIGASSSPTDLMLANVDERYLIVPATDPDYPKQLLDLLDRARPDLIHVQNDFEVRAVSRLRKEIEDLGVRIFMPFQDTIENCVDKHLSYLLWRQAGVRTPETLLIESEADLKRALNYFGGKCWLRATEGGGGRGALPADDFDFARMWISRFNGWGEFTAAEMLTPETVTWLSIWFQGELVVAQTRRRRSWHFGNRTLSGVTGVTGVGETWSDDEVTQLSLDAVGAVDQRPHGIFAVDMTYDGEGRPNVTEINISRFFTTVHFFTVAGVNFPRIFVDLAICGKRPQLDQKLNPLPDGLLWIRGMDREPVLVPSSEVEALVATQPAQ